MALSYQARPAKSTQSTQLFCKDLNFYRMCKKIYKQYAKQGDVKNHANYAKLGHQSIMHSIQLQEWNHEAP